MVVQAQHELTSSASLLPSSCAPPLNARLALDGFVHKRSGEEREDRGE